MWSELPFENICDWRMAIKWLHGIRGSVLHLFYFRLVFFGERKNDFGIILNSILTFQPHQYVIKEVERDTILMLFNRQKLSFCSSLCCRILKQTWKGPVEISLRGWMIRSFPGDWGNAADITKHRNSVTVSTPKPENLSREFDYYVPTISP